MKTVQPVQPICSLITMFREHMNEFEEELQTRFGTICIASELLPFDHTDYYHEQMGSPLWRKLYAFTPMVDPAALPDMKINAIRMEREVTKRMGSPVQRAINVDPGYVALSKMVLATTKDRSHRIYLRDGIYAEVTLRFEKGSFVPTPHTYPDYASEAYRNFFNEVRRFHLRELREKGLHTIGGQRWRS